MTGHQNAKAGGVYWPTAAAWLMGTDPGHRFEPVAFPKAGRFDIEWPPTLRSYRCACGEPGFEVPTALADRVAEIQVDEYLDSDDDRGYSTEDDDRIPPPEEGEPE